MSRLSLTQDIEELIEEVTPLISRNAKPPEVIRIALWRMKEDLLLKSKIELNDPRHPFYNKTTLSEELALTKAFEDTGKRGSSKEVIEWLHD